MTRKEEISKAARDYTERQTAGLLGIEKQIAISSYEAGAMWANSHPKSHWHSVADGDWPKWLKGDAEDMPFVVMLKGGHHVFAYYDEDENGVCDFYDDCDCPIEVEYWMEIPKIPEKVRRFVEDNIDKLSDEALINEFKERGLKV